jgi:hypothetical protein
MSDRDDKDTYSWIKSCLKKTRFRDKAQAKDAKQRLQGKTDKFWRYYYCSYCCGYHLTTKPEIIQVEELQNK